MLNRCAIGILLVLSALLVCRASASELLTLSPQNYEECAPKGKEAGAFFGDYVLRNDRIAVAVADPTLLMGRSASRWAIRNVAGAVIDLTVHEGGNDGLTAYYPAVFRFKPDAPVAQSGLPDESLTWRKPGREPVRGRTVTLKLPTYEMGSGKMLRELAKLPKHLQGAPKPVIDVHYTLADGRRYVLVEVVYTNPTKKSVELDLFSALRAEGTFEAGTALDGRLFYVYDKWWGQAYGLLAEDHRLTVRSGRNGLHRLQWVRDGKRTVELPPGESFRVKRRLFFGRDLFEVRAIAADILGQELNPLNLHLTARDGPVRDADVVVRTGGEVFGAGRPDEKGRLHIMLPPGKAELEVQAYGRPAVTRTIDSGRTDELTVTCAAAARVALDVRDGQGAPVPCKVAFHGIDGTASPNFFPEAGEHMVRNLCYAHDGRAVRILPPGRYELIISHGPEYACVRRTVQAVAGETVNVEAELRRLVETPGWISADMHNHSTVSGASEVFYVYPYHKCPSVDGDSTASQRGRVLNLLAEQIEFAVPTEHNFISSYEPHLKALGAESLMATCPGIGLTAGRRHTLSHQNVFPVVHVPGKQDGGALQRPEHIRQLEWMLKWDNGAEKVVQIAWPRRDPLELRPGMEVIDVQALEPIVEGRPIARLDNRILEWVEKLNAGYHLPGVINSGTFDNYHGAGAVRNYVKSSTDDPAKIKPLEVARAVEAGHVIMTTGPFMDVRLSAGEQSAIPGDTVKLDAGEVMLGVRVRCNNVTEIDRVQVLLNGERSTELTFARDQVAADSGEDMRQWTRRVPLTIREDTHVIVVASGTGQNLHGPRGGGKARRLHVAVSNPIYLDVKTHGVGFTPHCPFDDAVEARVEFVDPPVMSTSAEPGRVRLTLRNTGAHPAADEVTLVTYPEGAVRIIGPKTQSYSLTHLNAETTVDWLIAFNEGFIAENFPRTSTYNNARTFGLQVARGSKFPGRRRAGRWMALEYPIASLPPLAGADEVRRALAGETEYPVRRRGKYQKLAEMQFGVAGDRLAVHAEVIDAEPSQHRIPWEGSCIEIFGSMPGRHLDKSLKGLAPGGYWRIRQVYLVPQVGEAPGVGYYRRTEEYIPDPQISIRTTRTDEGYILDALIPLSRLGIDVDTIFRNVRLHGNQTAAFLMKDSARAGRLLLEARVNTTPQAGADIMRGTIFGSPAPHADHLAFGRMRMQRKVRCELEIIRPIRPEADAPPGTVRMHLENLTDEPLSDTVRLVLDPPEVARVVGDSAVRYELAPGEKRVQDFRIALAPDVTASSFYLVVPRSPKGQVVGTASPRMEIADRPLVQMGRIEDVTKLDEALGRRLYPITIGDRRVADVRVALAGDRLAVRARVKDAEVRQHARPWKGSSFEVFGAMPGSEAIGQVFLIPAAGGKPAHGLLATDGKQVPERSILTASEKTKDGYEIRALIPLNLLKLDAAAERMHLEFQTSSVGTDGTRRYGTVFGSDLAYLHNNKYGRFRVVPGD